MKSIKHLAVILLSFVFIQKSQAQQTMLAFEKGESSIQLGFGLGMTYSSNKSKVPPLQFRYEKAVTEYISVGGILGYSATTYQFDNIEYNEYTGGIEYSKTGIDQSYLLIGARSNYHFETGEKFDPYGGVTLGYNNISTGSGTTSGANLDSSMMLFGAQVGANYYFSPKLGAWAEFGYGISYLNLGVAFKL